MDKEEKGRWSMARNFRRSGWRREHELHTAVSARSALSLLLGLLGRANDLLTHRTVHSPLRCYSAKDVPTRSILVQLSPSTKKKKEKIATIFFLKWFANNSVLSISHRPLIARSSSDILRPIPSFASSSFSLPVDSSTTMAGDFGRGYLNRPLRNDK